MAACGKEAQPTTVPSSAGPASGAVSEASRRSYWLTEGQFAQGDYLGAVQLWRHALLQLPKTASADPIRHALVLQMAYGWLAAAEASGEAQRTANIRQARKLNRETDEPDRIHVQQGQVATHGLQSRKVAGARRKQEVLQREVAPTSSRLLHSPTDVFPASKETSPPTEVRLASQP